MQSDKVPWRWLVLPFAGGVRYPFAWAIYLVSERLLGEAMALCDTPNPVAPLWLDLSLGVIDFPMAHLWKMFGGTVRDWLNTHLTDNEIVELFIAINSLFWAAVASRVLRLVCSSPRPSSRGEARA